MTGLSQHPRLTTRSGITSVARDLLLPRARLIASLALLLTALASGGQAAYMTAKAQLAQGLLLRAWDQSQASGEPVKPWPWADTHPVALLEIPRLNIRQVVLDSHSGEAMAFGPGLVSVEGSHVLGGHRDSHLAFAQRLEPDDLIRLTTADGQVWPYRVGNLQIVDSRQTPDYRPPADSLSLITCYPFDALTPGGPLRYVVTALSV